MTDANANIQINGSVAPIIEAELAKLNASLQRTISNLQLFNSSSKTLSTGTDTIGVALNGISKGLKDTSHHLQQLTVQQASLSAGFRNNSKAIDETVKQIERLRKANSQASQTGIKFDLAPLKRYQTQLEAVNKASQSITTANKAATFKQIGAGYEGLSQKLNYASQRLTFGLSLPIAGFLRMGFNSLKSMSTQTIRLNKLLDDAYSSSAKLGSGVMSLDQAMTAINKNLDAISGKWGVSRELLQGIAGDFAEIGISSTDALAVLTQTTVEFEKLGNVDITQAGETVRALYQNMARIRRDKGLGVTSSKDIKEMMAEVRGAVALFNYAENKTSLSLKNMAEAFPEVASAATSFGLDMATTAALLVPMIGAGIKTGTAANSIKISLQGLVNVTKKAKIDLEELNKTFGTDIAVGGEIGAEGLQKLANAYTRLKDETNDAQVLSTFGDFFGKRQAPRFEIAIQQASQFTEKIKDASSAEAQLLGGLENRINASLKLNKMNTIQIKDIKDIANLTKLAQERDSSGNFTAQANLIQKAQREQVKNLTDQEKLGKSINDISTEYGKIQVGGAFGSALTGQTLIDELKKAEQSLEVKYGKARENIKSISRELTVVLADILNVLNPIIQKIATAFQNMSSPVKKIIGLVLVLAAVIGPMVRTFAAGFQLVGAISRGFGKITEIKSMGKSTVELNKELLKTNDLAFRIGGKFEAFGKNGSVFTDKKNIKPLQKLSALQEKEDSGETLTKLEQSDKKMALTKLAGRRAVRDGTALSQKRDFSKVDLVTEEALKKIYRPQDQIRDVGDAAMRSANAAVYKGRRGNTKAPVTAESLGKKVRDTASSRSAGSSAAATSATPAVSAVPVPMPTRTSGAAPASNIYEPILKQILAVLRGIEVCACAGKAAMAGPSTPPTSGPTASPRGPTPVAPAGGATAAPAPSSSPDLSKLSDDELAAGIAEIDAELKKVDGEIKASEDLIAKLREEGAKAKRSAAQVRLDKAKLGTRGAADIAMGTSAVVPTVIEDSKPTPAKATKPRAPKEKIFKPIADFADKLDAETMALMQQAGVTEATSAQKVGVAFDLTKKNLINLFEALGKEVPEGLKKITEIVDKATGEAIRITPASLAKIKASIESGKLQSLVDEGVGNTGNRALNEAIRGAKGTTKQKATSNVTYGNIRSGRDRDQFDTVSESLATGNVQLQRSTEHYTKLFNELKKLSIESGATASDIKNLDMSFRKFLKTLKEIEDVNEGSLIPDIKNTAQLSDAMNDTFRGKKSRIAKFGKANSVRTSGMNISEQDLQESLGSVPSDLRVDPKIQSALEAKLPKNRTFYKVKRQEYSLNNPLRAESVSSGETTKGKKFEYGPLAGMVKKPIDKLTDAQYEKFSAARKAMIEKARRSLEMKQSRPEDEVADFKNTSGPSFVGEPKGSGKRSEKIVAEGDIQGMLDKRRAELESEYGKGALTNRLMKRFEETTRARVGRSNKPIEKAAEVKAKKTTEQVVDDGPALSADEYIAQKKARLAAEEAEKKRVEKNAKAKAKRDAAKAAKAAGGGGAVGGTSFGGLDDPFAAVMGGTQSRGPRMPKAPGVAFVDKGAITGGVSSVYEQIRQALNIPVEIMDKVIAELKAKHNVITGVGTSLTTEINGDLNGVIQAIKGTLGAADMTVENVKQAFVDQRNKIGKLRSGSGPSAKSSAPAAKTGMIGNINRVDLVASGDDAYAQMQKLAAHMKEFGIDLSQLNQLSAKQLQYLADAIKGGTERTKPVVPRKLTDSKAKAIAIIEEAIGDKITKDAVTVAAAPTRPTRVTKPKDAPAGSIPTPPPETKPSSITTPAAIFSDEDKARVRANVAASKAVREAIMAAKVRANVAASAVVRAAKASAPLEQAQRAMAARVRANVAASKAVRVARASAPMEQAQRTAEKARNDLAKIRDKNEMSTRIRANVAASAEVRQARLNAPREQAQRTVDKKTQKLKDLFAPYKNLKLGENFASRNIEQQQLPDRMLNMLNPLRKISQRVTPNRVGFVAKALSGKAPTLEYRKTDIITGEDQEQRQGLSDVYRQAKKGLLPTRKGVASATRASATRGLMAVGRGLQKTPLAPVFESVYEPYMPTALQMQTGRGGRLQSTVAGQRPTTGMAGGSARQGVFQRLGIQTPQPVSTGQREGLKNVMQGANLPSAFEVGSVKLLSSIKKLSPIFDTAIQVAAKMAIEGGKLPYTVAKVYGKAVIDAHKITGQAISTAYSIFKASSFAQNNPIGKTLLTLANTIEKTVGSVSNTIKATVNAVKNPAQTLGAAKNAIEQAGKNFLAAARKAAGNFVKGKEVLDDAGNATGERKGGLFQPFRSTKEAFSKEGRAKMGAKFTGLKASAGAGIRNAASQGISSLTMGLGPLGALADGPLNKIVNIMLKFKKVSMAASLPILLIVGTIMLLKATFGAFGDKAGNTMKNFKNVINIIKNVVDALKRAFFDFFASLFGPAKDSEGAMGNVGSKVEAVSNVVARFANAFSRVFKKTILPAIYSILSGLSLLIRGVVKIFGGIFNIIKGIVQKFTGQGDKAGKSFDKGLSMLKDGFMKALKGIIKFLAIPIKIIINVFMKLVEFIVQLFEFLVIGVVNLIRYMVKGIINLAFTIVKAYVWVIDKIIELFVMLQKAAINIALALVKGVINVFFGIVKGVISVVKSIITIFAQLPAGVGKGIGMIAGLIANLIRGIADKLGSIPLIGGKIKGALYNVAGGFEAAGDAAEGFGQSTTNNLEKGINAVFDPVQNKIQGVQNSIIGFIDKIGGAALSNIGKLNNLGDYVLKALGGVQNALLDGVNNAADAINRLVGSASDGINKLRQGIINWIEDITKGDDITKGIGDKMKDEVKETLDEISDPQAAIAAGKIIAAGIQKGLKELKLNFYEKVTESLGDSLSKLKDGMKDALGKQKDEQLKFFDDQIAAIDALAAAEEELTNKKKYEEDRRERIAERALQKDAYRKNRALAIYEGRVEDARSMSLQEEKDNRDFNKEIQGMDTDRKNVLQGQNRDAAKAAIERQKQEASEQFDLQIKNFEDLIENIGKYGTLSKEDLQAQFTALNNQAVATSGSMKKAFQDYYTALPGIIQANTDPTVGFFTAGIDTLIAAAAGKYGSAQGVSDPTTMLGLTNQMLANTGAAYTAGFNTTIIPNYRTGQDAITGIATDFADETKPNSLAGIYKLAISNATAAITAEFVKMKTEASAAFAEVVKGINDELKNLAISQAITDAKAEIANSGGSTTGGGTQTGTPSAPSSSTTPAGSTPAVPVANRFGPANIAKAAFETALGADGLFKDGDTHNYIKKAKEALSFYGYSGFSTATGDFGPKTITALKSFQKDYNVGGNNDGNLGVSAANSLGLFSNAGVQKKYNGGMIKKMMSGGAVPGFSNQGVPALLHGGEYVINAKAVQNLGMSVLAQLNGLKNGVPSINVPKPQIPNSSGMNMNITSHSTSETTQNYNFYVDNFIGEDQWFESMMKDYNIKVVPNNQKAAGLESRVVRTYNGINRGM